VKSGPWRIDVVQETGSTNADLLARAAAHRYITVIRAIAALRKIDDGPDDCLINGARSDLVLGTREFPVLGRVDLLNGDARQPL